jgi:hypothetical protein
VNGRKRPTKDRASLLHRVAKLMEQKNQISTINNFRNGWVISQSESEIDLVLIF